MCGKLQFLRLSRGKLISHGALVVADVVEKKKKIWILLVYGHKSEQHSPRNTLNVWSCWTSQREPDSGQRRGWAHAWLLGSCATAGGCCSDTRQSGEEKKYHKSDYTQFSGFGILNLTNRWSHLGRRCVKSAADRPVAIFAGKMAVFKHCTGSNRERISHWDKTMFHHGETYLVDKSIILIHQDVIRQRAEGCWKTI